jgi:hypothetical protein
MMRSAAKVMKNVNRANIAAVSCGSDYTFSKQNHEKINLIAGLGVEGDAHMGATVQHLSRIAKDPMQPNLRQVHLIHAELLEELLSSRASGMNARVWDATLLAYAVHPPTV